MLTYSLRHLLQVLICDHTDGLLSSLQSIVHLDSSFLSFLGLGIQPPATSWGLLISYGAETMEEYPWLLIFPGCALTLTLFSLNFLGDGLRDALDVRGSKD